MDTDRQLCTATRPAIVTRTAAAYMAIMMLASSVAVPVRACNCAHSNLLIGQQVAAFYATADPFRKVTAFQGTVTSIETVGTNRHVTFAARRWWGTKVDADVMVETGLGDGDCGYPFEVGQEYVVFADSFRGAGWYTNICSLTRANDADVLGPLGRGIDIPQPRSFMLLFWSIALLIVCGVGAYWRARRRSKSVELTPVNALR